MKFTIHDNILKTEDFIRLFSGAGWGEIPYDQAEISIKNSYASFSAECDGKIIGMVRLLGDGGMAFFLKDFVISPEYQGKGIGTALLRHAEEYISSQLKKGWQGYLQLVSAKGKEGFYLKSGYVLHPHEHSGAGMSKWIDGEKIF